MEKHFTSWEILPNLPKQNLKDTKDPVVTIYISAEASPSKRRKATQICKNCPLINKGRCTGIDSETYLQPARFNGILEDWKSAPCANELLPPDENSLN